MVRRTPEHAMVAGGFAGTVRKKGEAESEKSQRKERRNGRMKEEGHYVGNHTAWHPDLTQKSVRDIKLEIKANKYLRKKLK